MANCPECKNAIFDALWGDHECKIHQRATPDIQNCSDYSHGTPEESARNKEYFENFDDCETGPAS